MNQEKPKVIASVLVKDNNRYLLVKETLESGKNYWIIPGGKVEFGETLVEAAKREIKEETNLNIEILKFINFKEAIVTKYNYHTIIFFFLAKPLNKKIITDDKVIEAKFFSKEEIKNLNLVDSAKWLLKEYKIYR